MLLNLYIPNEKNKIFFYLNFLNFRKLNPFRKQDDDKNKNKDDKDKMNVTVKLKVIQR